MTVVWYGNDLKGFYSMKSFGEEMSSRNCVHISSTRNWISPSLYKAIRTVNVSVQGHNHNWIRNRFGLLCEKRSRRRCLITVKIYGVVYWIWFVFSSDSLLTLDQLVGDGPEDAVELTKKLLMLDPLRRLTAKEAIQHCYVERWVWKLWYFLLMTITGFKGVIQAVINGDSSKGRPRVMRGNC